MYNNGDVYVGNLVDSKREGLGKEVWLNGEQYVGEYKAKEAKKSRFALFVNFCLFRAERGTGRANACMQTDRRMREVLCRTKRADLACL